MTEKVKEVPYGIYGGKGLDDLAHFPEGMWFTNYEPWWRDFLKEDLWSSKMGYLTERQLKVPFEYMT